MPSPGLPEASDGTGPGTLASIYLGQQLSSQEMGLAEGGKALGWESAAPVSSMSGRWRQVRPTEGEPVNPPRELGDGQAGLALPHSIAVGGQ